MRIYVPTETEEQKTFIQYLELKKIMYASVPNENMMSFLDKATAIRTEQKLKTLGKKKGFPDLMVFVDGRVLFVEMKRVKGSTTSEEQKEWIKFLQDQGHIAVVCKGAKEAIAVVEENL